MGYVLIVATPLKCMLPVREVFFCALESGGGVRGDVLSCAVARLPPLPLLTSCYCYSLAPCALICCFFAPRVPILSLLLLLITYCRIRRIDYARACRMPAKPCYVSARYKLLSEVKHGLNGLVR